MDCSGSKGSGPFLFEGMQWKKQVNRALGKNYMGDNIGGIESSPALSRDWEQLAVNLSKNWLGQGTRCPEKLLNSRIVLPTCSSALLGSLRMCQAPAVLVVTPQPLGWALLGAPSSKHSQFHLPRAPERAWNKQTSQMATLFKVSKIQPDKVLIH